MQFHAVRRHPFALAVLIASLALSACGGGNTGTETTPNAGAMQVPSVAVTAVPVAASSISSEAAASDALAAPSPSASASADYPARKAQAVTPKAVPATSTGTGNKSPTAQVLASVPAASISTSIPSTSSNGVSVSVGNTGGAGGSIAAAGVTEAASPTALAVAPTTALVGSAVQAGLESSKTFASDNWLWTLECVGKVLSANAVPETGIKGNAYGSSSQILRFGKVTDPLNSSRKVLNFTVNRDDPLIASAPRCEVGYSPTQAGKLPLGQDFWFGFGLYLPGWKQSADEQVVVQWQTTGNKVSLNPPLAISVLGSSLRIVSRTGAGSTLTKTTATTPILVNSSGLPTAGWTYIVIKARVEHGSTARPYLKVWRDGTKIVDSTAPVAYDLPGAVLYAKFGHYHWIDASNPWPAAIPTRSLLHRAPITVLDPSGTYTEADIRSYLMR